MKKIIVLMLLFFSLHLHSSELSLKISTGFEAPETNLVESILQEGFKRAGVALDYYIMPNQRSLLNANQGIMDGEAARIWKINEFYSSLVRIPISTYSIDIVVLSKEKIVIKEFSELKNYNVGVVRGMKIAERSVKKAEPRSYVAATNNRALIKMLEKDRIDVIVSNKIALLASLKESKNIIFYMGEKPLLSLPLYMHLHTKHQELVPRFEKAFHSMVEDGTYEAIKELFIKNIQLKDTVKMVPND